jgi:hypothetical protein
MTDLPQQPVSQDQSQPSQPVPPSSPAGYSGSSKEIEGSHIVSPELPLKAVGQEVVIPKEVEQAGVKVHPTTVPLPPQITQTGVQSVGANVPIAPTSGSTVVLPLNDTQIAQALHESVTSSIRWLAEWCVRQIKIIHGKLKTKN